MKNLILKFSIFALFLCNSLPALAFYQDVPTSHKYHEAISELYEAELLPEKTTLNPDALLDLPTLYEILLTFGKAELNTNPNLPFSNTDNSADYAFYLQTAIDLEILKKDGQTFPFEKKVSKIETLKTFFETLNIGVDIFNDREAFPFKDIKKNSKNGAIAQKAYDIGIVESLKPELFKSSKRITVGEAINYLYLIKQFKETAGETPTIKVTPIKNLETYTKTEKKLLDNKSFDVLLDVWTKLQDEYLYQDELDNEELIYGAIKGMLDLVSDKYTIFETPSESSIIESLSSTYEGLGMSLEMIDSKPTIIAPFKNSPAEKAGIKAKDIIKKIDGKEVSKLTIEEIIAKIKGAAGTKVKITVERGGAELTIEATRAKITNKSVEHEVLTQGSKKIGYISISSFSSDSDTEFKTAATALKNEEIKGLIIDLRNNPGGYMDAAINMISSFTDTEKTAVTLEFADGTKQSYNTTKDGKLKNIPTIVITNGGSASASEILAGALKDYGIAKIVGQTTFGKGIVQQVEEYKDGSIFKYTVSKWLTPNGKDIHKKGIVPDYQVTPSTTKDAELEKALSLL